MKVLGELDMAACHKGMQHIYVSHESAGTQGPLNIFLFKTSNQIPKKTEVQRSSVICSVLLEKPILEFKFELYSAFFSKLC